ncbi:MAG: RIP metalloprotease RseP [Acidobacteria bacterium]|nr:RIP metalloprotease RseP [Acidobacteriota bacterium]
MTTALSFLFVLGVLVFVHELGHFLVARWHGVRVITFSLGFGTKILKFERGGTEYCISLIPLGGYVKLAGETVEENRTGAPDEFLSKSKWVRFQVYIAGPIMNILLAWIVLAGVLSQGADVPLFESSAPVIGTVAENSPAAGAGLRVGDRILTVDGRSVGTWEALSIEVLPRAGRELTVLVARDGGQVSVRITPDAIGRYEFGDIGIGPVLRPQVMQVNPGTPAERAGLRSGDVLVAVGGERSLTQERVIERIRASANAPLLLLVARDGAEVELSVVPEGSVGSATIGVSLSPYETRRIDPTMLEAFRLSAVQNWESTKLIGRTLRGLFTADTPVRQLMGPVAIAEMSGTAASIGWVALFNLMAMISLNLGLLNLMPVPVLDGGHIAILAVEGIARRDLSIKVKERILTVGAVAIVLLMVTVIFNDISRLLR